MPLVDYRSKYMDLKTKYMETVDLAWRLGYEQGLKDAQTEQAQQQQMQSDAMAQQAAGQPGAPSEGTSDATNLETESTPPISQNPNGDELDQHIAKLEGMLGKSEISSLDLSDLKKTLSDIKSLQIQSNLTKSLASIKNTKLVKSMTPFAPLSKTQANLSQPAQKALSLQEKIVNNIFTKWESDEAKASSDITSILGIEGITKRD